MKREVRKAAEAGGRVERWDEQREQRREVCISAGDVTDQRCVGKGQSRDGRSARKLRSSAAKDVVVQIESREDWKIVEDGAHISHEVVGV